MTTSDFEKKYLEAMSKAEEKASSNNSPIITLQSPGVYNIRILPDRVKEIEWWATYGTHYIDLKKIGQQKGKMFVCDNHTFDKPCSLCTAITKAKAKAKEAPSPQTEALASIASEAYASPRYLVNAIIENFDPNKVVVLQINKTFIEKLFTFSRLVGLRFQSLEGNIMVQVNATQSQRFRGLELEVAGRGPTEDNLTGRISREMLYDLSEVVTEKVSYMSRPSAFTGDFYNPLPAAAPTGAAAMLPGMGMPMGMLPGVTTAPAPVAVPVMPVAQPATAPVTQPVATPVAQPAAVPVMQPVAMPVAQPEMPSAFAPAAAPVAAPAAAPTPVVQTTPGALSSEEAANLEKYLLQIAGGSQA